MFTVQKIVVMCLLALMVVVVGYAVSRESDTEPVDTVAEDADGTAMMTAEEENDSSIAGVASLQALLDRGEDLRCTYQFSDESATGSGEGYFSADRMRIESTFTTDEGVTYLTNMIDDGTTLFTWTSSPEGDFAMKFASPEPDEEPMDDQGFSTSQEVQYDCEEWNVNESTFVPPSDLEFMDLDAMMNMSM